MTTTLSREGVIRSFEPSGGREIAMIELSEGGRLEVPESLLPTLARFDSATFDVRIKLSETPFDFENTHDDLTTTGSTRITYEPDFLSGPARWYLSHDSELGPGLGVNCDDFPEALQGEDGEGYLWFELTYDHEATLAEQFFSPKQIARKQGLLNRSTGGIDIKWSLREGQVEAWTIDSRRQTMYAATDGADIVAVDVATGDHRWETHIDGDTPSEIAADADRVYTARDQQVIALSPDTGTVL